MISDSETPLRGAAFHLIVANFFFVLQFVGALWKSEMHFDCATRRGSWSRATRDSSPDIYKAAHFWF